MIKPRMASMPAEHPPMRNGELIKQECKKGVIHAMGEYIDFEAGSDLHAKELLDFYNLAAHYLVTPSGIIIETLPYKYMGAHAKGHNKQSVGIEFLVPGLHTLATLYKAMDTDGWVTKEAFDAGVKLVAWLKHNGVLEWTRHDVTDPDRKRDPGKGFPEARFFEEVDCLL